MHGKPVDEPANSALGGHGPRHAGHAVARATGGAVRSPYGGVIAVDDVTVPTNVVISVRGNAERTVAPDAARLQCALRAVAPTKSDALQQAAAAQAALLDDLARLGG